MKMALSSNLDVVLISLRRVELDFVLGFLFWNGLSNVS